MVCLFLKIDLIEEQQQLLQSRLRMKNSDGGADVNPGMLETQKMILKRKILRKELAERQDEVESQQLDKNAEHKTLHVMQNQLIGLERSLVEQRTDFLTMADTYLEKDAGNSGVFSRYAALSSKLTSKLSSINGELKVFEQVINMKETKAEPHDKEASEELTKRNQRKNR